MNNKIKVAIFFGGRSAEYSVSLQSAYSVIKAIDLSKFEIIMIGITKSGQFKYFNDNVEMIKDDSWEKSSMPVSLDLSSELKPTIIVNNKEINFDIAFPILHGTNGEDGTIQGMFELLNIKYVGNDMSGSLLTMDKHIAKIILEKNGIESAPGTLIKKHYSIDKTINLISKLNYPLFIKPLKAGSSYGISKIFKQEELQEALNYAFKYDNQLIIEETIKGFEIGCAIIGNKKLITGAIDEIEISTDFFDFEEKYSLKNSAIHLPARISVSEMERATDIALKIYETLNLKGLARVDMFYTTDHKIIFNEVNTMPGFTSNSRFPNMLKAVGYTFEKIITDLIMLGLENE